MAKRLAQADRPRAWPNLWIVGGFIDEYEHARRLCEVLGYERDEDDHEVVRVRFLGQGDLFDAGEALIPPLLLFPFRATAAALRGMNA